VPGLLGADLIGVAVFAAQGASAAVAKRLDLFGVAFVGFVAALGGGILRDLLTGEIPGEIPVVLQRDLYAVVALGGAFAMAILSWLGMATPLPLGVATVPIIGVRLLALYRRWSAPVAMP
jgi:uncharacterized membrane protein YeiH